MRAIDLSGPKPESDAGDVERYQRFTIAYAEAAKQVALSACFVPALANIATVHLDRERHDAWVRRLAQQ